MYSGTTLFYEVKIFVLQKKGSIVTKTRIDLLTYIL
ncbi:hypothetical protein SAMN05444395_102366 [Flavobacterium fryxellicola]|nr:hypothetical protein SAMN05444395_102366 [Flavobacterium fryxellicola]